MAPQNASSDIWLEITSALSISLPSFPLCKHRTQLFCFSFPAVIQVGTHLLKCNQSTGSFGHRYPSVR